MLEERSFSVPQETFKRQYSRFRGLEHYIFRIDKSNMDNLVGKLGDTSKYKKGVTEYFDFGIQKDIKLIKNDDTIPCSICQLDANTGISQYYTFSLGFYNKSDTSQEDVSEPEVDRGFIYSNKILHTGNIMLHIKRKAINNVPVLKMM